MQNKIIVILGPTGVGKTSIAIELAQEINGEIISADSMLVYKYMDIGSAKPSIEEREKVKHYLIDIVEPYEEYNVSDFISDAKQAIKEILSKGKVPIICGGTNYYVYSLLNGVSEGPEADIKIREKFNSILKDKGIDYLYEMLVKIDPVSAGNIHKNNVKRVIRALEVCEITGKMHSRMQRKHGISEEYDIIKIGLMRDREELNLRIEQRVKEMFKAGLIEEVNSLISMGVKKSETACVGIGYREVISNQLSVNSQQSIVNIGELEEKIIQNTRRLVKKQLTWLRKDSKIKWFNLSEENNVLFGSPLIRGFGG